MSVEISDKVVQNIESKIRKELTKNQLEDRIREKLERAMLNADESTLRSVVSSKSSNYKNIDNPREVADLLDKDVSKFLNNFYKNMSNIIRDKISELESKLSSYADEHITISSIGEFEKFIKNNRAQHIMVAPGDELFFLATLGLIVGFFMFYGLLVVMTMIFGHGMYALYIVGAFIAAVVGGISIKKAIPKIRSAYQDMV